MIVTLRGSEINGQVSAPPSKSMTHRVLVLSALADGCSTILNPLSSDDTAATISVLEVLGVTFNRNNKEWIIHGDQIKAPKSPLICGESGTTLRFMTAICGLVKGKATLAGGLSLSKRPIQPLVNAMNKLGVNCLCDNGFPPVDVEGVGHIEGGTVELPGDISSQFVSAILLVAPLAEKQIEIRLTTSLESKPYVSMTMDAMRCFGSTPSASSDMNSFTAPLGKYNPTKVSVEGDWSSAAYFLGAGALSGEVIIEGINPHSNQADKAILEILDALNADVEFSNGEVRVRKSELQGITWDLSDCPDLFPIVSSLCAVSNGESTLTGVRRLRYKESNRIVAMQECLKSMGVQIHVDENVVKITGRHVKGAKINPHSDHRVAMSIAVLGLIAEGETTIYNANCVSKSYPSFWHELEVLGANIRRD